MHAVNEVHREHQPVRLEERPRNIRVQQVHQGSLQT